MIAALRNSLMMVTVLLTGMAGAQESSAFGPGEQSTYVVSYLGLRAGKAQITVGAQTQQWGREVIPLVALAQTDSLGAMFPIQDKFVSYWDPAANETVGSDFLANENKQKRRQRMKFDHVARKALVSKQKEGASATESTKDIPEGAMDMASATFALRNKELGLNKEFEIPVFTGGKSFTLKAKVESIEKIDSDLGEREAYKIRVQTAFSGKFESKRDMYAWLTTDPSHIPLRIEAEFAIGSLVAELTDYKGGMKLAARPTRLDTGGGSP